MNMKLLEILPTIMSHCHCWCCCWEYFHLGLWLRFSIYSTLPVKIAEAFVGGRTNREKEMVRRHKSGSGKVTNQEWTWITNPCNVSPVAGSVITGHLSVRHSRLFVPRRSGGRVWYLYIYLRWPEHVIEIETHNRTQPTNATLSLLYWRLANNKFWLVVWKLRIPEKLSDIYKKSSVWQKTHWLFAVDRIVDCLLIFVNWKKEKDGWGMYGVLLFGVLIAFVRLGSAFKHLLASAYVWSYLGKHTSGNSVSHLTPPRAPPQLLAFFLKISSLTYIFNDWPSASVMII